MLKIAMLSTGEEVLHGDIVDTNAAWLSEKFFQHGFSLSKRSTVGDNMPALVEELMMLSFNYDVVLVNGGLGPTSDDMSAEAAARAAETDLELYSQWTDKLEKHFADRGVEMPESNRKQAMLPRGSVILDNPIGTACGFSLSFNDCDFYFTPGVPSEFHLMVESVILPQLEKHHPDVIGYDCSKLYSLGLSESYLSDVMAKVELPQGYTLGYRSYLPFIEVKLFGPKGDIDNRVRLLKIIHNLIEENIVSVDETMEDYLGHLIVEKAHSISTAEQSTYGYLTKLLNSNDQATHYCEHGWILGERTDVGETNNDPLAAILALAGATREKCHTHISLATGKVKDQIFSLAIATPKGEWGQTLSFNRSLSRDDKIILIATIAADMLRRYFLEKEMFPKYGSLTRTKQIYVPRDLLHH
ncbi:CinA-like protein [Vibrio zhanjiangensis]|uniref:CinA-like protein n=1 Tax=Vibrio zhanjiangensis TaxID=1046128 RepID=A0ABQ6EUI1_9VIBR|nr:CinA family nicotinamide mononucleotide deamidase-related protein [Vibrio zhanjiangensis]GLT16822.1 CinA-like protein [Vibrio zhanjiangensis]